ncbi:single-strand selective monofunctional uracil DNA glycosylase isoform X1 [Procambarus clarkii]|uniref:single-strand selective monofunctional uracil DNA glycosylase isoform X1 n=1 Tax=Procambarus clarkii TaxID=6728 RepID=UPI00374242A7
MHPKSKKLKTNNETTAEGNQLQSTGGDKVSHIANMDTKSQNSTAESHVDNISIAQQLLEIEKNQCEDLLKLDYGEKICYIYNPVDYAHELHSDFVIKYGNWRKKVLILGMNPGPWGMGQTGVPFGHVGYTKDWLNIKGSVSKPIKEHPKRPVTGLECTRNEVSGDRMWGLLKDLSGSPQVLFSHLFLHNYCPLFFLKESAKNVTPPELKVKERARLEQICDDALVKTIELLGVEHVIGVGNYATVRTRAALLKAGIEGVQVSTLMHPSPVNPAANKGWHAIATKQLTDSGIIHYFKPNP